MLRQETIKKWINGSSLEKVYFYLEWNDNELLPIKQASWYHKIPNNIKWKKIIKIGYREIILCSSFTPNNLKINDDLKDYHSFLISHLQKAIRRNKITASLYTTDLLLEIEPVKLLRRLPIIMLEDTQLHHSYSTLIWLMCLVSSNFRLEENHKRWILGVVYLLSVSKYKEHFDYNDKWIFYKKIKSIHSIKNILLQDIIYSLETRKCYGGMEGDKNMITSFQNIYLNRYLHNDIDSKFETFFYQKVKPIMTKKIKFNQKDWLLEAYDFHINKSLPWVIECEFPEYNTDDYKEAIWYKSSGINFRSLIQYNNKFIYCKKNIIPNQITEIWNKIRIYVRRKSWGFIQRMLEDLHSVYPDWVEFN